MREQTREAIDLLLRGATRFGGVLRQHFKAKTAPDCETGSVVEKEVSRRGLAALDRRVERIASQLARVKRHADHGGRALTIALDDFEREYNALSRGAKRYCRRSDAWIASQRKFTAFALGYLRGIASAPQGGKRAPEAPTKAESPKPEAKPEKAPQKPAEKAPEGNRELPTAEDCRDRGVEAFKGKYAVVQAIACCVHAAARDNGVKPSEFRITRARGSHLSLTVRMVRTGRSMRFTGTTTPKGYRSACNSVSAFFSSLAKATKKDEKPTVKPNYPKTRTVQVALASHGLRAESTMPADLLALEFSAYTMTSADQDRIADEHRAMVERLLKKGVEIDPRVAAHYNLAHVEHAPVVPEEPKLTTEQLSELTDDQKALLARLETMPLDDAETEYQKIAKAARFTGSGIDAVFRGKHRVAIVENKREIQEMKGRNEDLPEDKRLASLKGTAHEGKANAVDYWIVFPKSVTKAEAETILNGYLDVLDAAGHQGRNDIVSLWTKTMRALGYSDALIRANHLKDAAKRIMSKRRAEAAKEATSDVKWVRVDLEQNVVRLKFGRKPAAGSESTLKAAGYGLVSKGHENPYWRATWNQKARDAALAVGASAVDLPEIAAAPKPVEKPAPKAEAKPVEAPAPAAPPLQVEAAPAAEASKPDANLETMARMVAELLVRPEGATTGEISAAGGGTPTAVYKALAGLGVATITGTQVNPTGGGRNVGTDNVWQVRGVDDNGVSERGAKRIRIVLAALGLPPVDVKVTNEETPKPAPEAKSIRWPVGSRVREGGHPERGVGTVIAVGVRPEEGHSSRQVRWDSDALLIDESKYPWYRASQLHEPDGASAPTEKTPAPRPATIPPPARAEVPEAPKLVMPEPKFKPGDFVERDNGIQKGSKVESRGVWDEFLKTFTYQVRSGGHRTYWNETSMVPSKQEIAPTIPEAPKPAAKSHYTDEMASKETRQRWVKSVGHLAWVWNKGVGEWYEIGTRDGKGVYAYAAPASATVDPTTGIRPYNFFNSSDSARDWLRDVWGYRGTMQSTKPAPEAPTAPPVPVEQTPAAQPAKDPALQWHKPVGNPCSVCGVNEPRLKALHRMLSPEEQDRTGCKYLKSVKVSFGGDSEETCIGERVPRTAAAKRLSAVLLQPSGFTKKDIYGSNSTNLGAENLRAAMENLRRDGVLVRDYSSNAPPRTGYETREELEKLSAEMSREEQSAWHVVGVSEQGITPKGAENVLKTIKAFGLPEVEVTATVSAIEHTEPTNNTDEAVRRAAEEIARELGFELEPEETPASEPVTTAPPLASTPTSKWKDDPVYAAKITEVQAAEIEMNNLLGKFDGAKRKRYEDNIAKLQPLLRRYDHGGAGFTDGEDLMFSSAEITSLRDVMRDAASTTRPTPTPAPKPEPAAPPPPSVESPDEKRARELAERFRQGLSGRMGGKTISPPSAPEPPTAPAPREMSAQEKANAEMAAFLEEWGS